MKKIWFFAGRDIEGSIFLRGDGFIGKVTSVAEVLDLESQDGCMKRYEAVREFCDEYDLPILAIGCATRDELQCQIEGQR